MCAVCHRCLCGVLITAFATVYSPAWLCAGDWPQILGPHRNGQATDETLATSWTPAGPTKLWSIEVGQGYAGPAVKDARVVVFHRLANEEVLTCVSADQGQQIWESRWPTNYVSRIDRDAGPRCVPLIHGDAIYVFGAGGWLRSVNFADGKPRWSRNLSGDYKAQDGYFGSGSCPLVVDNMLLVNAGGRRAEAGIVALDLATGESRWSTLDDHASYSAPIVRRHDDQTSAIFITRMHLLELDPSNGKVGFDLQFGKQGPTVNAASPLLIGNHHLLVTASYGIGAKFISLSEQPPRVVWESDNVLSSQYPTPVHHAGNVFGIHGREDMGLAELRCIDVKTGATHWRKKNFGMAHLIVADGKLLVQRTEGELRLVQLTNVSYRELGRMELTSAIARAQPALSNSVLFIRDTNGKLMAWKLP